MLREKKSTLQDFLRRGDNNNNNNNNNNEIWWHGWIIVRCFGRSAIALRDRSFEDPQQNVEGKKINFARFLNERGQTPSTQKQTRRVVGGGGGELEAVR